MFLNFITGALNSSFFYFQVCTMCMFVHIYVSGVCLHMCMCEEVRDRYWMSLLMAFYFMYWNKISYWSQSSWIWLSWQATSLSIFLSLPLQCSPDILCMAEIRTQVLMLCTLPIKLPPAPDFNSWSLLSLGTGLIQVKLPFSLSSFQLP